MLNIKIISVGKIKEKFFSAACSEYQKRLLRYVKLELIELADEKAPESLSDSQMEQVKAAEGERILAKLKADDYAIALAIKGQRLTSEELAAKIQSLMNYGISRVAFIIGGSLGLSEQILQRADMHLSFSDFTFCHQLMKVVLMEQIYRAEKILANEPYHK